LFELNFWPEDEKRRQQKMHSAWERSTGGRRVNAREIIVTIQEGNEEPLCDDCNDDKNESQESSPRWLRLLLLGNDPITATNIFTIIAHTMGPELLVPQNASSRGERTTSTMMMSRHCTHNKRNRFE